MDFSFLNADNLTGGVTVGAMIIAFLRLQLGDLKKESREHKERADAFAAEMQDLKRKMAESVDAKIKGLEENCKRHQNEAAITGIQTTLTNMGETLKEIKGSILRVDDKVEAAQGVAGEAKIRAYGHGKWIEQHEERHNVKSMGG